MNNEALVLKYFHSWQVPADFDELSSCLSNTFSIDAGFFSFTDKERFISFLKENPTPWKEVNLISSMYTSNRAAMLYEGVNTENEKKMRVAELIQIEGGLITDVQTVITELN